MISSHANDSKNGTPLLNFLNLPKWTCLPTWKYSAHVQPGANDVGSLNSTESSE